MPIQPTLEKKWTDPAYYFDLAAETTTALQNQALFVAVKAGMKSFANGWATRGSSDATTAAMDTTDRITDKTKVVANAAGAHTWWVGRNTDGLEICCAFNGATPNLMTVAMSVAAGFSGGSTTARPTATDEEVVISAAEWAVGSGAGGNVRMHVHVMHSEDGKNTYAFVLTSGRVVSMWLMGGVSDPEDGWVPKIVYVDGAGASTVTTLQGYARRFTASRIIGHSNTLGKIDMRITLPGTGNAELAATQQGRESNTGNWQNWSMGLVSLTSTKIGWHGRLTDLWLVPAGMPSGWLTPTADGTARLINFGTLLVPYPKSWTARVI